MKYTVYLSMVVSTAVEVEADDYESALELVYDSPDMPGSMTHGAFGAASVDESGDWQPVTVAADDGTVVWEEVE